MIPWLNNHRFQKPDRNFTNEYIKSIDHAFVTNCHPIAGFTMRKFPQQYISMYWNSEDYATNNKNSLCMYS